MRCGRDRARESRAWVERARGWIRVLHWDAFLSAVIYTFATVVFYLLGAAVLGRVHLNPSGSQMIRTLSEMYVPVFGETAHIIFLFGAISVLYSTFFVAVLDPGLQRVDAGCLLYGLRLRQSAGFPDPVEWCDTGDHAAHAGLCRPLFPLSKVSPPTLSGKVVGFLSVAVGCGPDDRRGLGSPDPHFACSGVDSLRMPARPQGPVLCRRELPSEGV